MGTIDVRKMAGYSLIIGPVIALISYFIQPGGVLMIGGTADPTKSAEVIKILTENSALGIITGLLVPLGLITMLSGIMYFVQSMEGGNGHALARTGLPFLFIAIVGWSVASGMGIGISMGLITEGVISDLFFAINIPSTMLFGFGGILIALGASTREELNSNLSLAAALGATVVFIATFVLAFAPDQANTINIVTGICFMIYTIWSIIIGRGMTR